MNGNRFCSTFFNGFETLNFNNTYWLYSGDDRSAHQLGWHFFKNDIFNILSGNYTVNQIVQKIKKRKKNLKIKLVNSAIMNQLSYHVSCKKINNEGLYLRNKIDKDINDTLDLLNNI